METQTPQTPQNIQMVQIKNSKSGGKKIRPIMKKEWSDNMDFSKFRDVNVTVKKINIKLNTGLFDMYTPLYNTVVKIDGCNHKLSVLRCGYLGLTFLLVDNVPTIQLYGSHKTISENLCSLGLSDNVLHRINRYIEYND